MNPIPQQWLAAGTTVPGLLGCGMRLPDSTYRSYSFNERCPREHLDQALQQLAGTMTLLAAHGLTSSRLTWTFEQGQIFLIARPDGALLALATRPNSEASKNVDHLAGEFFALNPRH